METQQISEAESTREHLQDLQDQIETHKAAKQEAEAELERQKQVSVGGEEIVVSWLHRCMDSGRPCGR